jgi:NSS family neurotransmitter:Na+ symporter
VSEVQRFSSRWGMMVVMLGMAVGTGNIWRFPRIVATNGGGSFLIAWAVFLLLWSVPLLLVEFAMGRASRRGPIGAFANLVGKGYAWMGAWVAFCATAIMFYYSVVMGWTIRYLWGSVSQGVPMTSPELATAFWDGYAGSPTAVLTHAIAMALGLFVVARGVKGIERAARILIPGLFILVIALAVRAMTLPGAFAGLEFMFTPNWADLASPDIWIQALTQNAWDTGAGWGLVVAYAVYMRKSEDTALNAFVLGFGNNSVSLLAGIMVLGTLFATMPEAADVVVGAGNEGLTFIWVPQLFGQMPAGNWFMVFFFLALVFAAWSSLIAMIELATRVLMDAGLNRKRAITLVGSAGFLFGLPSALSIPFFQNQDWVWGVGLMVSGFFFAFAVMKYGVDRFRIDLINQAGGDITIGRWWNWAMRLVIVESVVLTVWWLWQAVQGGDLAATLTPFSSFNVGTVLVQWAVVLVVLIWLNRFMADRMSGSPDAGGS